MKEILIVAAVAIAANCIVPFVAALADPVLIAAEWSAGHSDHYTLGEYWRLKTETRKH
jgi:hypothetical protein